jgi:hypothetical protein
MSKGMDLLTEGLKRSFTGQTVLETVNRVGFVFQRSHFERDGQNYVDEWLPNRTVGGQEIAQAEDEKFTRLYAGGVISAGELQKLGITEKEVVNYIFKKVSELGNKTRLFTDYVAEPDGDWQYAYRITDRIQSVELTRSIETLDYKGIQVFVHGFEICRIRE